MNNLGGDLSGVSAKKEALLARCNSSWDTFKSFKVLLSIVDNLRQHGGVNQTKTEL